MHPEWSLVIRLLSMGGRRVLGAAIAQLSFQLA